MYIAIKVKRKEAVINLRIIIVTGFISVSNVFVATKDVPQKITARSISRYRNDFVFVKML